MLVFFEVVAEMGFSGGSGFNSPISGCDFDGPLEPS